MANIMLRRRGSSPAHVKTPALAAAGLFCSALIFFLANAAHASSTSLTFQASTDGITWTSAVTARTGQRVLVRVVASYTQHTPGPAPMGLASIYFQPTLSNWSAGNDSMLPFAASGTNTTGGAVPDVSGTDAPLGRIMPFAATGPSERDPYTTHEQSVLGISYARIARASATQWPLPWSSGSTGGSGSVVASQRAVANTIPSEGPFNFGLVDVVIMKFGFVAGRPAGAGGGSLTSRRLAVSSPPQTLLNNWQTGVPEAAWYASETDTFGQIRSAVTIRPASVTIVPAPALTFPALALMVWARRRR
jgi:hypothetical protein